MKTRLGYVWICTIKRTPTSKMEHKIVVAVGKGRKKKSEITKYLNKEGYQCVTSLKVDARDIKILTEI